ncbi:MAG: hypothetical protein IJQ07_03190 [Clostridia bacterium]|nr:hypothetical protein [Clostridia bacterium]
MKVRLIISVSKKGLPAFLTVRTFQGKLIFSKMVRCGLNEVCFCSANRKLIFSLMPINADYLGLSYYLKLPACPCQTVRVHFDIKESERTALQSFTLYDKNYNFPIISALLRFFKY